MKKIFTSLMSLALVASLTACSGDLQLRLARQLQAVPAQVTQSPCIHLTLQKPSTC